jgi:hypothetical protein
MGLIRRLMDWRRQRKRRLFRFHDGKRWRYADPIAASRALNTDKAVDLTTIFPALQQGREPETTQFLDAVCRAFGVHRFQPDGSGMTDEELCDLFADLTAYLEDVKKNTAPPATSLPPTESESSLGSSDADDPTTK